MSARNKQPVPHKRATVLGRPYKKTKSIPSCRSQNIYKTNIPKPIDNMRGGSIIMVSTLKEVHTMKKLLSIALAILLLGSTVVMLWGCDGNDNGSNSTGNGDRPGQDVTRNIPASLMNMTFNPRSQRFENYLCEEEGYIHFPIGPIVSFYSEFRRDFESFWAYDHGKTFGEWMANQQSVD